MFLVSFLGLSRIGDNKKVSQIEMLADEQLLVLISGKGRILVCCHSVEPCELLSSASNRVVFRSFVGMKMNTGTFKHSS